MLYAFGDESYPNGTDGRAAAYLVIAVRQEAYKLRAADLRDAFQSSGKKRQRLLSETLRRLEASVVLGRAELPTHLETVKAVEEPSTGRVSLRAALWAWIFGFTCSTALLSAIRSGVVFSCVDFYYDTKDLTTSYREHIDGTLRRILQQQLAEYSSLRSGPNAQQPVLRRVKPIPKPPASYSPQHLQLGVGCADALLKFGLKSPQEAVEFMEFRDFSGIIEGMLTGGEIVTEAVESIPPNPAARADC